MIHQAVCSTIDMLTPTRDQWRSLRRHAPRASIKQPRPHIRRGLVVALERDPHVVRNRLQGALAPDALCAFAWDSMLSSIKHGDPSCQTLFALLRATMY